MLIYRIESEQEEDGRWLAEVPNLAGVMAYGSSQSEAIANTEILALRVLADHIEEERVAIPAFSFQAV